MYDVVICVGGGVVGGGCGECGWVRVRGIFGDERRGGDGFVG